MMAVQRYFNSVKALHMQTGQTHQQSEPDDVALSCSSSSETASSEASKRELTAWNAVKDHMLLRCHFNLGHQ